MKIVYEVPDAYIEERLLTADSSTPHMVTTAQGGIHAGEKVMLMNGMNVPIRQAVLQAIYILRAVEQEGVDHAEGSVEVSQPD